MTPSNATAMRLAWHFFKGNYALNFSALAILVVLSLLGALPIVGLLFFGAYTILSFSAQIYFGRHVAQVGEPVQMEEVAKKTRLGEYLTTYLPQAAGGFLAFFAISMLFGILFTLAAATAPAAAATQAVPAGGAGMAEAIAGQILMAISPASLVVLLLAVGLLYIFPAVAGRIIFSDDFAQAFRAGFLLFSPSLWKKSFNRDYFLLVAGWSLVVFGFVLLSMALSATVILLPLSLVLAYILSLYNAAIYVFAERLAR